MKKIALLMTGLLFAIMAKAQYTLIPDENFEYALIDLGIDQIGLLDGKVLTSNIENVEYLDIHGREIESLNGISGFHSLKTLLCDSNYIVNLDLVNNLDLETLNADFNPLSGLIALPPWLKYISFENTERTSFSQGNFQLLEELWIGFNDELTSLSMVNCPNLERLDAQNNEVLGSINLQGCTGLEVLYTPNTNLESIDLSDLPSLKELVIWNNSITELDLSQNPDLEELDCSDNSNLSFIDLKNGNTTGGINFNIDDCDNLYCIQVDYPSSPYPFNESPHTLVTAECGLEEFTLIPDAAFEQVLIDLGYDSILDGKVYTPNIDNELLTVLDVSNRGIFDLTGIEDFTYLEELNCSNNDLSALNLSQNEFLKDLNCGANQLTSLNLTQNELLEKINSSYNQIENLDLSQNTVLIHIFVNNNALTSLNVKNGNNSNVPSGSFFNALNNPSLFCIEVDNITYSSMAWSNIDDIANFSTDCETMAGYTYVPDENFEAALELEGVGDGIPNNHYISTSLANSFSTPLSIGYSDIEDLTGIEAFTSVKTLHCEGNLLTEIDLSQNTALEYLYCDFNSNLTELNVNGCTSLKEIRASFCNLKSLPLAGSPALEYLNSSFNSLINIDVSQNTNLYFLRLTENNLQGLNLKNGNNLNFTSFRASGNSDLTCIQVDDETWANANWSSEIDETTSFSDDCPYVTWLINDQWSNASGPDSGETLFVEGNLEIGTNYTDLDINKLFVLPAANLNVLSDYSITMEGTIINLSGAENFTIQSGANLIQTGDSINEGEITIKRNSTEMVRNDMTLWSSPVTGQTLRSFSPETLYNRFWIYNETNDSYEQRFTSDNEDAEFDLANGYAIRVRNTLPSGQTEIMEGTFVGNPNNGIINVAVAANGNGYNLIGNPYPSNIEIQGEDGFLATNPQINAIYFWTHQYPLLESGYVGNNYAAFTQAGSNLGDLDYISTAQGFIVRTNAPGTVEFNNAMRVNTNADFYKTEDEIERNRIWLSLSDSSTKLDQILVGYITGATDEQDNQIDAEVLIKGKTALYSIIDEKEFAVQGRTLPFDSSDIVPLGFFTETPGAFKIKMEDFDGLFAEGQQVFLKDNQVENIHNLSESDYEFETEAGEFKDRFEIVYQETPTMNVQDFWANGILIYQSKNEIIVESENEYLNQIQLYDLTGRKLAEYRNLNTLKFHIDATSLLKGVYIIQVQTINGKETSKKIIH
ncbi:MAG: T9SS sorting signal type C domain-containing protein [Moheibacter sp.]